MLDPHPKTPANPPQGLSLWLSRLAFPAFLIAVVAATIWFWPVIHNFFENAEAEKRWLEGLGFWGPVVFVGLQILQVIVFVIPGEVTQLAGGYLFGLAEGTALSLLGIALGSAFNFFLARTLGMRFVEAVFGKAKVEQFEAFINNPKLALVFFLLFLIPGLPKDALCYMAGLSRLRFLPFLILSTVARLPGILFSSFMGNAAGERDWTAVIIAGAIALTLFGLGYLYRTQIEAWLAKWTLSQPSPDTDKKSED